LVEGLAQRVELVGVVSPELSRLERYVNYARTFHPRMSKWRSRAGFNRRFATKQTESVQRSLQDHWGTFDLIIQFQTLCAPGFDRGGVPYAIYTDNTMALTRRLYPAWAPISARTAEWWMEYEAGIFRDAAEVFTYSEFARRSVIDDYGCSPDSVVAVGAGANQFLSSLGEKDYTVPRAVFVGFEFERKGGSVLLDAWPTVRDRVPDAELLIAGPAVSPRATLPPGVTWVGRADRAGLGTLYESASVFVMPSLFEPWGHVFVEAMGHGLPCIGTRCCAMPEIIDDGVTGLLVETHQPEPLAHALIELFTDAAKAAAMGRAAHAEVCQARLWTDVADRVLAHLDGNLSVSGGEQG
jgi:glycosyltransferase involved in cell wall biosynthesis